MKYDIKHEEALYKQTGKLSSHPHIFCSKTGEKVTAFGSNLANKIKKAGSLQNLLETFECRAVRNKDKVRLPKAPKRTKKVSRESKTAELLSNIPKINFTKMEPIVLLDNPELAGELTRSSCVRPDIFLDNSRSCDFCSLYSVCKAPCRNLSKQGWQAGKVVAA